MIEYKIWEERYISDKYGKERNSSFKYFKMFLAMGMGRSIKKLHEQLVADNDKMSNNSNKKRVPSYKTLRNYSSKWDWYKRAKAYDDYVISYIDNLSIQAKQEFIIDQIDKAVSRVDIVNDEFFKFVNDDSISPLEMSKLIYKNVVSYNKALDSFYKIANDGIKKIRTELEANVETNLNLFDDDLQKQIIDERNREIANLSRCFDDDNCM